MIINNFRFNVLCFLMQKGCVVLSNGEMYGLPISLDLNGRIDLSNKEHATDKPNGPSD